MYLLDTDVLSNLMKRAPSSAPSRGLSVVTGNERHFRRVSGLETENWLAE